MTYEHSDENEYKLKSSDMVFAPNVIRFLIAHSEENFQQASEILMATWPVPEHAAKRLLELEVYIIRDDNTVVFYA